MSSFGSLFHVRMAAVIAGLGVALGAFGAHGLKEHFADIDDRAAGWWATAVMYHLIHAVALFALASSPWFVRSAWRCLAIGILLFSGSLYVMALTGMTKLGIVTPLGGLAFMFGWIWIALSRRPPAFAADSSEPPRL